MKILTLYNGTLQSKTALQYALNRVRDAGGELLVLQVFQSSLFVDYDAGPRAEEIARAEAARHLREAEVLIREAGGQGLAVRAITAEGDPIDETLRIAEAEKVELIIAPERYKAVVKRASCRVRLVPGTILVPVDSSEELSAVMNSIVTEAAATRSSIVLVGIVPIHLYSRGEQAELELVRNSTVVAVKKIKQALSDQGLEVRDIMRSGYPDVEIMKAAEEYAATLIMLPAGGKTPSELTKAAAILMEEQERVKLPIHLLRTAAAS